MGEPGNPGLAAAPGAASGGKGSQEEEEEAVRRLGGVEVAVPGAALVFDFGADVAGKGVNADSEGAAAMAASRCACHARPVWSDRS